MLSVTGQTFGANLDKPPSIVRGPAARLPWAWDALYFAVPFNTSDRLGMIDVINNVQPSNVVGATFVRDNRGNISCNLDASSYIDYADHPRHDRPSSEITVYARFKRNGAGDVFGGIVSMIYSESAPWTTWAMGDSSSGNGQLNASITAPTTADFHSTTDTAIVPTTEYVSAFLRWRTGSAHTIDVLGERGQSMYSITDDETTNSPILYAASKGIRINGNEQEPPDSFNAQYSQVLVWGRKLSNTEMTAIVADPFGWCSPRRETVTMAAPFPVGPGFAEPGLVYTGMAGHS